MSKAHEGCKRKLSLMGDGRLEGKIYINDFPSEISDPKNGMHILFQGVREFL